uniref:Putative secreted protein n=1 Tax=Anopheles darlingi TaxID=43151 RepID=A0A2M4D3Z0_ANODA
MSRILSLFCNAQLLLSNFTDTNVKTSNHHKHYHNPFNQNTSGYTLHAETNDEAVACARPKTRNNTEEIYKSQTQHSLTDTHTHIPSFDERKSGKMLRADHHRAPPCGSIFPNRIPSRNGRRLSVPSLPPPMPYVRPGKEFLPIRFDTALVEGNAGKRKEKPKKKENSEAYARSMKHDRAVCAFGRILRCDASSEIAGGRNGMERSVTARWAPRGIRDRWKMKNDVKSAEGANAAPRLRMKFVFD